MQNVPLIALSRRVRSGVSLRLLGRTEARDLLLTVPQPTAEDIKRRGRPEAVMTLDQLDKHAVLKVMGKTAQRLLEDNR